MHAWGLSDVGNVRAQNQDAFRIDRISDTALLAVVCDGMGGAKSGNVASRLAGEVFSEEVLRSFRSDATREETEQMFLSAAKLANISVYEHSQISEAYSGMGTTLVSCLVYEKGALILNVGDSRAYHIDADGIRRVTTDHSLVEMMVLRGEITPEEAKVHPRRNLITRAVGTTGSVTPDTYWLQPEKGDCFLLCSDGLSNLVSQQEILFEVAHGARKDDCCQRLVEIAKDRGAPDNVTALLVSV